MARPTLVEICDQDASKIKREVILQNAEENTDPFLLPFAFVDVSTCTVRTEEVGNSDSSSSNLNGDDLTKSSHSHQYCTLPQCCEEKGIKAKEVLSSFLDVKKECDVDVNNCDPVDCPSSFEVKNLQTSNKNLKEIVADAASLSMLENGGLFKTKNTSSEETDRFEAENKQLRLKVEELEAKLNQKEEIESSFKIVYEKLGIIQNQISQMGEKYDLRFSKIEESISDLKAVQSLPSTSAGISRSTSIPSMSADADDRIVELGAGLCCSTYCYKTLISKQDIPISVWVVTFLRGCFGEKAHLVRWRKSPGTTKLTHAQKIVASGLFRQWLEGIEVPSENPGEMKKKFSETAIAELCFQFPSYLGDRAYSIGLPLKESDSGQNPKKNMMNKDDNTVPKPKRRYIRKGEEASSSIRIRRLS